MHDIRRDDCNGNQKGSDDDPHRDIPLCQLSRNIQLRRNQVEEKITHNQKNNANGTKHKGANSTNPKVFGKSHKGKQGSRRQQIHDFSPGSRLQKISLIRQQQPYSTTGNERCKAERT